MRIVVFCGWPSDRLLSWHDALRETPAITDLLVVPLGDASQTPAPDDGQQPHSIARVRAWRPDLGIALGVPKLPPALHTIPLKGTLGLHFGEGPDASQRDPGFWELWHRATETRATVYWLGIDRAGVGAVAAAPVYPSDTVNRVASRADELARMLVSNAVDRVAAGKSIGDERVQPPPIDRPPSSTKRLRLWARLALARARRRLHPRMLAKFAAAAAWLALVRPVRDLARAVRRRHRVRVFTLHRVSFLSRDGMTVSPSAFRKQLEYVRRHHDVVDLDEAVALIQQGARLGRPVAAITFDDGYSSVYRAARPIMSALGVRGTVFVCPDVVENHGRFPHDEDSPAKEWLDVMDWKTIGALRDAGWRIGSHGATHARLSTLAGEALLRELHDSRIALREKLGESRVPVAYPYGGKDDISAEGVEAARWCGYTALFSDFGGDNVPGADDRFQLRRTDIGGDHDTLMWKAMIHGLDLRRFRNAVRGARDA